MRSFRSDNNAGLVPEAWQAIQLADQQGHAMGYGDDEWTSRAVRAFESIFGTEIAVFFVATGTAANVLAIASLTESWQQVICHEHSHYNDDESTAPERITHCRTNPTKKEDPKITVEDLEAIFINGRGDVHQPQPGVVTISNATEFGTTYTPQEISDLCTSAHAHGYRVHVDGARFANAVAGQGCDPRELINQAGVDALSFGGTKNGLAFGEAVIFFQQGDGAAFERALHAFPFHRKGTGHLLSKHRYASAPFALTLETGAWLKHAAHANEMARLLGDGLMQRGLPPRFPVEANAIFVQLPKSIDEALQRAGHGYYPFGPAHWNISRLMCSHDTTPEDVARFLETVDEALENTAAQNLPK